MSLIDISDLTFGYDGSYDTVFESLNLQFDTDWKLGLVGRNGRGKTTLLHLLQGRYEYRGSIAAPCEFDYFPFETPNPEQATRELLKRQSPDVPDWMLLRELSLLQVDEGVLERPFATLSNGERTKVMLAALFVRESRFLLIDEPTNHLDLEGRRLVGDYLNRKSGFLLVSHDRDFLDRCVDHILAINNTGMELVRGNYSGWWQDKQNRDRLELERDQHLRRDIGRLSETARRTADWSDRVESSKKNNKISGLRPDRGYLGHKSAKMMKRAKTLEARRDRAVEEKKQLLQDIETADPLRLAPLTHHSKLLAEVRDLSVSYGLHQALDRISLTVEQGERVALRGKNGSGKSTLLKLMMGEELPHVGSVRLASGLILSTLPQEYEGLSGSLRDCAERQGVDLTALLSFLKKLGIPRSQFEKDLSEFSAGQKKKVLLAVSLCKPAHLYIWDEPLNYIDLLSRVQIEELILAYRPSLLFVEHDASFCNAIATKTLTLP